MKTGSSEDIRRGLETTKITRWFSNHFGSRKLKRMRGRGRSRIIHYQIEYRQGEGIPSHIAAEQKMPLSSHDMIKTKRSSDKRNNKRKSQSPHHRLGDSRALHLQCPVDNSIIR
ncbi:unnamed protein product [Sphagnum balticum]